MLSNEELRQQLAINAPKDPPDWFQHINPKEPEKPIVTESLPTAVVNILNAVLAGNEDKHNDNAKRLMEDLGRSGVIFEHGKAFCSIIGGDPRHLVCIGDLCEKYRKLRKEHEAKLENWRKVECPKARLTQWIWAYADFAMESQVVRFTA